MRLPKKIVVPATLAGMGIAAALIAQTGGSSPSASPRPVTAAKAVPAAAPADAAKYKAMVDRYCVGCHNKRTPLPADDPLNLEGANFNDLVSNAATWERVLRKLSVRAMPPQGMPRPAEADYAGFTTW
ncbi:MAG: hypothetical protein RL328_1244, partial [Acidobacteriota bacterium]